MEIQRKTYGQMLLEAIDAGLSSIFEPGTAKSVKFYIDPHIAIKNPMLYPKLLEKIFGEGAKQILGRITGQIALRFKFTLRVEMTFEEAVMKARAEYLRHV